MSNDKERIIAAAIFDGAIITLPPPARHHTILQTMALQLNLNGLVAPQCEGFITSKGRFVNRVEAYHLAHSAEQIQRKTGNTTEPTLYSEDLW